MTKINLIQLMPVLVCVNVDKKYTIIIIKPVHHFISRMCQQTTTLKQSCMTTCFNSRCIMQFELSTKYANKYICVIAKCHGGTMAVFISSAESTVYKKVQIKHLYQMKIRKTISRATTHQLNIWIYVPSYSYTISRSLHCNNTAELRRENETRPDTARDDTLRLPGSRCRKTPGTENNESATNTSINMCSVKQAVWLNLKATAKLTEL